MDTAGRIALVFAIPVLIIFLLCLCLLLRNRKAGTDGA